MITVALGQLHCLQRLRQGTDLVDFHQNGVGHMEFDPRVQTFYIGHEQIVSHQLNPIPQPLRHLLPAVPVVFRQAVLNGIDGELLNQPLIIGDHLLGVPYHLLAFQAALSGKMIHPCLFIEQFTAGHIQGDFNILSRRVAGGVDGFHNIAQHALRVRKIRSKTPLVPHTCGKTLLL